MAIREPIAIPADGQGRILLAVEILALTEVESVALWTGLMVGVASVVLAIVAIYFSIEVDRRSAKATAESIRALERIEGAVSAQSSDTRDLIKVGWERMLGNVGPPPQSSSEAGIREAAAGIASEIRAELGLSSPVQKGEAMPRVEQVDEALDELQETIEGLIRANRVQPSDQVQFWMARASELSDEALATARALGRGHVTGEEMQKLQAESEVVGGALTELRRAGILIPLEGYDRSRKRTLVYWFPPGSSRTVKSVLLMLPESDPDLVSVIRSELESVGYPNKPSPEDRDEFE